jgi:3-deoxy-D-manno-octulosonic-acid transferase
MKVLYNISIFLIGFGLRFLSLFNPKAREFVTGRRQIFPKIREALKDNTAPVIWLHCASLGEFEQGRPLLEAFRRELPSYKIFLTFFSPSGYTVRKNSSGADYVFYLPLDTRKNAKKFISIVKPTMAIFVKYEFWYHYIRILKKRKIPVISVSSIFRKNQLYFRKTGNFNRRILKNITHFFVQNGESLELLRSIDIYNATLSGDTRFDRVRKIVDMAEEVPIVQRFKGNDRVFVVGSAWQEDIDVLMPFMNEEKLKFIIAPHEIHQHQLDALQKSLVVKSVLYSQADEDGVEDATVLIIDNVGMLSRLYRYGEFAFVGGAYGKGLHNILEAACYGMPILFGDKNYEKFQEAMDLINRGGAFPVRDYPDLKKKFELLNTPETFQLACEVTRQYVTENTGATEKVMDYCRQVLLKPGV